MRFLFVLTSIVLVGSAAGRAQEPEWPRTRAEASEYRETSTFDDVWSFLHALNAAGAPFVVSSMGRSTEGREIPLVVAAAGSQITTPAAARRSGRVVVYVQANIHAGEVEGKEAALMLLRELADGSAAHLLEKLVLLVAPIYNCDGNEAWGSVERNRRGQNGPARVGRRPNGMGLDLNRDCMKAESPEMRGALAHVYTEWEPDVILDLHTTNGTHHGYDLTYSPPLSPNTESGVLAFSRDVLLPTVRRRLLEKHGIETFDYGNLRPRNEPEGWWTFEPHGRFVTNYAGLRNRIGVLSEATSYRPFAERVHSTRHFVREVLELVAERGEEIVSLTRAADARVAAWGRDADAAPQLGVRFEHANRGEEDVRMERTPAGSDPGAKPEISIERYPIYDRFTATHTAQFPAAYLLPARFPEVLELLLRHGVIVERTDVPWGGTVQSFQIETLEVGERPFQGHRLKHLDGEFKAEEQSYPAGTYLVRTSQPLGVLIFHLLEPESIDGVAAWSFLDRGLRQGGRYPIGKCLETPVVPAVRVRE